MMTYHVEGRYVGWAIVSDAGFEYGRYHTFGYACQVCKELNEEHS